MRWLLRPSGRLVGGSRATLIAGLTVFLLALGTPAASWAQEGTQGAERELSSDKTGRTDKAADKKGSEKRADKDAAGEKSTPGAEEAAPAEQITGSPAEVKLPGAVYGNTRIAGQFMIAFRGVSVGGNEDLYAKDIDLDDGLRVTGTNVVLTPADRTADSWYDRARLILDGVGGDPYETVSFALAKTGLYKVDLRTRKLDYFLYDPFSEHGWDEERRMTDARLSLTPVSGLELFADFGRWSKYGTRQTTRTISANTFAFDETLDQEVSNLAAGVRYTAASTGTTLFFTQEFNKYKFNVPATTTDNPGLEGPDRAVMYFLQQQEVRAMDAPVSFGGIDQKFLSGRARVHADFLYSKQKMAFTFNRYWEGTNFAQRPMREDDTGLGDATRELKHGNLTASGALHQLVTVYGKYRRRQWDQTANQTATESTVGSDGLGSISPTFYAPAYDITMDQFAVGADFHARQFNVFGEVGVLKEDVFYATQERDEGLDFEPEETTFKIGGSARARRVNLRLVYDRGDIDDPITRISPTKVDKLNLRVGAPVTSDVSANAFFTYRKSQNPEVGCCPPGADTDFRFEAMTFGLSATLSLIRNGWVTATYSYTDLDSSVPIDFPNGPANAIARYENQQHVVTFGGDYQVSDVVPFSVYGLLTWLSTDGISGDNVNLEIPQHPLGIGYYDVRLGGRWVHDSGLLIDGEARLIDYEDDFLQGLGVQGAYDATIFSIGVGWRFQ
jgi:hypothetical protein